MTSVGWILKAARESQGRAVAAIAEDLRLKPQYLIAIEGDDWESLPGIFFYKSFVKQYATLLGVDPAQLEPGIDALTGAAEPLPLPGADPRYQARTRRASYESLVESEDEDGVPLRS